MEILKDRFLIKKTNLKQSVHDYELLIEDKNLNDEEYDDFLSVKNELYSIYKDETIFWQQRARATWIKDGDANTRFFHRIASYQKNKSHINTLIIDNIEVSDENTISKHAFSYYRNILGSNNTPTMKLRSDIWAPHEMVRDEENIALTSPFTLEEIKAAVFEMDANKAAGPDGFSMLFYQQFWDIIKCNLYDLFIDFYNNNLDVSKFNRAIICLIPKKDKANTLKDFRPISLLNCIYKIFTKVLANRMYPILDRIISPHQTAFIKGRNIMETMITAHEILDSVHKNHDSGMLIKIDYEKAFDNVSWDYILQILKDRGFNQTWITWIEKLLYKGFSAVMINGKIGSYFECKKGVRQGDPISPYLFILVADSLDKILKLGITKGHFEGLGPTLSNGNKIMHLQYADDTLLFLKNDSQMLERVKYALQGFERISGLKINYAKT